MYTQIDTNFNISDVFLVETKHKTGNTTVTSTEAIRKPSELQEIDLEILMDYFEVVALKSFGEYVKPKTMRFLEEKEAKGGFVKLIESLMPVTGSWTNFVGAFKSTRSSTLKERLTGVGFDNFYQKASMQVGKGLAADKIDAYLEHLSRRIQVPAERQEDLKDVLEEIKYIDHNIWTANNILFSVDNGGNSKFVSLLSHRDEKTNKYDFVVCDIQSTFVLAPDTMVISKKLSVAGGLWQDEKEVEIKVNREVTSDDMKAVMSFFNVVVFKAFMENMGIKVDFPQL